jgi:hypothetical protein
MNKGQIYLYNKLLGKIQEYNPPDGYILGNGWKFTGKETINVDNPFDKLGKIDFIKKDKSIMEEMENNITIIKNNLEIDLTNPPPILYPNMKNKYDESLDKYNLAIQKGELTLLPYVNHQKKQLAYQNNVYSWKDPNCKAELMGFQYTRKDLIDKFISANRDNLEFLSNINKINLPIFIDFESVKYNKKEYFYMIGLCYKINNLYYEEQYTMNELTEQAEQNIFKLLNQRLRGINQDFKLVHWWHYEPTNYKKLAKKYNLDNYDDKWLDLHSIFEQQQIVIPGMFSFSLKNVCRAFYNKGYIKSIWDGKIKDGHESIGNALVYYKTRDLNIIKSIKEYNLIDCKVMMELYNFLSNK